MISGAGGASGGFYYDSGTQTTTAGGAGGAGGFVIINRMPQEPSTSMVVDITSGTTTFGYLALAQTPYYQTNLPLAKAFVGGNGTTATGTGGNPAGGTGGTISVSFTGFGYGLSGSAGGGGQGTGGSFLILRGTNLLSTLNATTQLSTTTPPFNYGVGGYTRINSGASGDATINPAGGAVCIVISYSS